MERIPKNNISDYADDERLRYNIGKGLVLLGISDKVLTYESTALNEMARTAIEMINNQEY